MEKWFRQLAIIVSCGGFVLLSACTTSEKKPDKDGPRGSVYSAYEEGSEPQSEELPSSDSTYGPEPVRVYPVALVIGPGHARAFAAVGVLRALSDANIPVGIVLGTGMGALVSALYANSGTINEFEWNFSKFKPQIFSRSMLGRIFGGSSSARKLEALLRQVFADQDVSHTRVPLQIGVFSEETDQFEIITQGNLARAVRGAIAEPNIISSSEWQGTKIHSASSVRPYLVDLAREAGVGPVIVVDVLDSTHRPEASGNKRQMGLYRRMLRARQNAEEELEQADLVIRPNMGGIGYFSFSKKTTTVYRGKVAANDLMQEIRALVGRKRKDDE